MFAWLGLFCRCGCSLVCEVLVSFVGHCRCGRSGWIDCVGVYCGEALFQGFKCLVTLGCPPSNFPQDLNVDLVLFLLFDHINFEGFTA